MKFKWNPITNKLDLVGDNGNGGNGITDVFVGQSSDDSDSGILRFVDGSEITIRLSNRVTNFVQTTTDDETNLIFMNLGDDPATFKVRGDVVGHNETSNLGVGFAFKGSVRTNGTTAFEISSEVNEEFAEGIMSQVEMELIVAANDVAINVTPVGLDGETINWSTFLTYRKVGEL